MFTGSHLPRILLAALLTAGSCLAQTNREAGVDTVSQGEIRDISVKGPSEDSPFFIERQDAKAAAANAGREGFGMYVPKPPKPPAAQQVKKFFKGMFASVKFSKKGDARLPMLLQVEPTDFSLAQTPELDVSLRVSNPDKQTIELVYPTDQRLEVVTKDAAGNVIGRWSEDRAFDPMEGFTAINPDEYVLYAEKIPTSRMKAGESYTIEASLAGQEGYLASIKVTPKP